MCSLALEATVLYCQRLQSEALVKHSRHFGCSREPRHSHMKRYMVYLWMKRFWHLIPIMHPHFQILWTPLWHNLGLSWVHFLTLTCAVFSSCDANSNCKCHAKLEGGQRIEYFYLNCLSFGCWLSAINQWFWLLYFALFVVHEVRIATMCANLVRALKWL